MNFESEVTNDDIKIENEMYSKPEPLKYDSARLNSVAWYFIMIFIQCDTLSYVCI